MKKERPILIVVAGPTAVGKTATCIDLAKQLRTVVLSADSRQFYREMHIGTAKPTKAEMEGVPHYFIDNLSVKDYYSVGDYEREVLSLLPKLFEQHSAVILTGGSGLFIKAVCEGIDDMPALKEGVRERLMEEFAQKGLPPLLQELGLKDPSYYNTVDHANHARIIRALEVIRSSGKPFSTFRHRQVKERPFEIVKIGLNRERNALYDRINQRVELMMDAGLLKEVEALKEYQSVNSLQTVGYKELFAYLDAEISLEEAVDLIKRNTRRYAKKQLTWFNKNSNFHWFHPSDKAGIVQYLSNQFPQLASFFA